MSMSLLNVSRMPGRIGIEAAAEVLGFSAHDIPILVATRMLKPLGKPKPNATKYFSSVEVESLSRDYEWLSKATQTVYAHWKNKNSRKSAHILAMRVDGNQTGTNVNSPGLAA